MKVSFRVLCIAVNCTVLLVLKSTQVDLNVNPDVNRLVAIVQTESGAVIGKIENLPHGRSVHEYLGIPYAEPPVGKLRFAAPKPIKPWSGVKRTTQFGASCPQPSISYDGSEINFTRTGRHIYASFLSKLILIYSVEVKPVKP